LSTPFSKTGRKGKRMEETGGQRGLIDNQVNNTIYFQRRGTSLRVQDICEGDGLTHQLFDQKGGGVCSLQRVGVSFTILVHLLVFKGTPVTT